MNLEELLSAKIAQHMADETSETSTIIPEAAIATLRELAAIYTAPCAFKVGDIVTPRRASGMRGIGQPHIVIEVFPEPIRALDADLIGADDITHRNFAAKIDMRVLTIHRGEIVAWASESFFYEPYNHSDAIQEVSEPPETSA